MIIQYLILPSVFCLIFPISLKHNLLELFSGIDVFCFTIYLHSKQPIKIHSVIDLQRMQNSISDKFIKSIAIIGESALCCIQCSDNTFVCELFKTGDWVIHNGVAKRVTKTIDGYIDSLDNEVAVIMKEESLELWEPEDEKYFWYKNDLVRFHETQANLGLLLESARGCSYYPAEKNFEDYCEPFIGKLPSNLKQDNTSISVK